MSDAEHRELASVLHNVQGKVAISGYKCDLITELYGDWKVIEAPAKTCHSTKGIRTEVLWVNYNIENNNYSKKNSQKSNQECQPQQLSLI